MKNSEPIGAIDLSQYVQLFYITNIFLYIKIYFFWEPTRIRISPKGFWTFAVFQGLVDVSESWDPLDVEMGPWEFQMLSLLCSFYESGRQRLFSHWRNQVWAEGGSKIIFFLVQILRNEQIFYLN